MSYTQWVSNGTNVSYVPKEKDTGEVITPFTTTAPGGVPNSSYAPSTYVLAASGAWIPQTVGTSVSEIRRPTAYTLLTSNPSPYFEATDTSLVYDSDTNHLTTNGRFELQGLSAQNDASFKFSSFQTKAQTWTSATLNISRNYASTRWTSGTEARYYLSTDGGTNWTLLLTDDYDNDPVTVTIFSHTLATSNPSSLSNYQVKVEIDAFSSGALGSVGVLDLQLYDIWIEGIYTVSGGSGTVTSITTTGANGVTISGGSTQTITTSGTFALALGNITPTSISTGTGSFSGDVEFAASIKSPNGSNSPVTIVPDGTGDLHVNADSLRLGDNNADATIATNGTGDLILTTHEGSATQGIIRLYDGANGNITLTPNGTGQVQVGSDQVVTLTASQTLTNKTLSTSSTWNGNTIGVAYGGTGLTTLTAGYIPYGNGTSAFGSSADLFWDSANSRLGVGTTSPTAKLTVSGTGTSSAIDFTNTTASTGRSYRWVSINSGGFAVEDMTASGAERMRIDSSGNVGLGTSSPLARLSIYTGSAGTLMTLQGSGTQFGFAQNVVGGANTCEIQTRDTTTLTLATRYLIRGGTDTANHEWYSGARGSESCKMFLEASTGNLGIGVGTASPSAKLTVNSGANRQIYIGQNTSNSNYNAISLNGSLSDSGLMGLAGGGTGDETLYVMSQGNMVFRTVGTNERMRIDSNGNVGIGTSTVVANFGGYKTLELNGTTGGLLSLDSNGTNNLQMYTNGSTVNVVTIGALPLTFGTNSTERMRIDSSGNVGIGKTPSYKLDVNGTINGTTFYSNGYTLAQQSSSYIQLFRQDGGIGIFLGGADPANYYDNLAHIFRDRSGGEWARINSTGLGIGTSSPSAKLQVNSSGNTPLNLVGSTACQINLNDGTQNANWGLGVGGVGITGIASPSTYPLVMYTNGSERMRITSGGELLIGTSSATYGGQLTVRGSGITVASFMNSNFVAATSGTQLNVNVGATTGNTNFQLQVNSGGGLAFNDLCLQPSGGNLLIGNTNGTEKLTVTGKIKASDVLLGNNGTKGYGAITTTTSTSTPTGGASGDHYYIY